MTPEAYPTEPVAIILSDGKSRAVRLTAAALRRLAKRQIALAKDPESTTVDQMLAVVWEALGPKDQEEIENIDALAELIDARAIEYLNAQLAQILPKTKPPNPPAPASEV